jgi:hypothetical protein
LDLKIQVNVSLQRLQYTRCFLHCRALHCAFIVAKGMLHEANREARETSRITGPAAAPALPGPDVSAACQSNAGVHQVASMEIAQCHHLVAL